MPTPDEPRIWGPAAAPSLLALRGIRLLEGEDGAGAGDDSDDDLDDLDPGAPPADEDADSDPEGADQLKDAGKQALQRMKDRLKAERAKRVQAEKDLAAARAPKGDDADADSIRTQAETAATQRANARIVRADVRAAAAGRLSDPSDALRYIDLEQFDVDDDGATDEDAIREAVDDLLEHRPYLAAQGQRRHGDGGNGPRGTSRPKPQLTREELKRLSPQERLDAQKDGQLADLLSGKS